MELGIIQTAWVEYLEANPELKGAGWLGKETPDGWKYCCIGGLLMSECARLGTQPKHYYPNGIQDAMYLTQNFSVSWLEYYEQYGLNDGMGLFTNITAYEGHLYTSLADMNDCKRLTWPQIAKFIRENPEIVFTKSV